MAFFLGRRHVLHDEPFICHGGIGHIFLKIQISLRCPEHGDKIRVLLSDCALMTGDDGREKTRIIRR